MVSIADSLLSYSKLLFSIVVCHVIGLNRFVVVVIMQSLGILLFLLVLINCANLAQVQICITH